MSRGLGQLRHLNVVLTAALLAFGAVWNPAPSISAASAAAPETSSTTTAGSNLIFEERHRERAEALMRDSRWADAAVEWEILALLRPDRADYAKNIEEARGRARAAMQDYVKAAAGARQRGEAQQAAQFYLKALSVDPANADVAKALRELQRQQASKRGTLGVAQLSHDNASSTSKKSARNHAMPSASERQDLESAVMMLRQGDYQGSAEMVQGYLRRYPDDDLGKQTLRDSYAALGEQRMEPGKKEELLNDLEKAQRTKRGRSPELAGTVQSMRKQVAQEYYERGLRAQRTDLEEAIRLWERSLQYDPDLTQAKLRLQQAKRMRQNLDAIEESQSAK